MFAESVKNSRAEDSVVSRADSQNHALATDIRFRHPREVWAFILAGCIGLFFLAASLYIAQCRLLWYDEIITALISRHGWPSEIMRILKTGVDQQPLPYYLLVKLSGQPLGYTAFSVRLPSALAMLVSLLVMFDCTRRLTDSLHGLMALAFLTCSALPYYGFEARPYALVVMWTSCSLWLWLNTSAQSRPAAWLFGLTIFGAVTAHYYAVFCLLPYAGSVLLDRRRPLVPIKMITGIMGACAGLTLLLPAIGALRTMSGSFWAPATPSALQEIFGDLFPHLIVLLPLVLLWIAIVGAVPWNPVPRAPMSPGERLGWLFLLMPLAGFLAARIATNAFYSRYFIGLLPGVAIAFSLLIWRNFRQQILVPVGITGLLAGTGILLCISHMRHPELISPPSAWGENLKMSRLLEMENASSVENKEFVVLPMGNILAVEVLYHTRHPERYRVLEDAALPDEPMAALNKRVARYLGLPMQLWNLNELQHHKNEAALADSPDETLRILERRGWDLRTRLYDPLRVTYFK